MADITYAEFEDKNGGINYPFSEHANLVDATGNELPQDLFLDAVLYPENGPCLLEKAESVDGVCIITIGTGSGIITGRFSADDDVLVLYNEYGVRRGSIVLGAGKNSFVDDPTVHEYSGAAFCGAVQVNMPCDGVRSIKVEDSRVSGDVVFVSGDGVAAVKPVVRRISNNEYSVRFDVVSNAVLDGSKNTGIRSIHILRQPGSYFNVIANDGQPYLFLTKNGTMSKKGLIGRDDICGKSSSVISREAVDKSYSDDCGSGYSSSSTGTGSGRCTCNPFYYYKVADIQKYAVTYGCGNILDSTGKMVLSYGYRDIPVVNGYTGVSTMRALFIESKITATFFVVDTSVAVRLSLKYTGDAEQLFQSEEGSPLNADLDRTIFLRQDTYQQFFNYFHSRKDSGLGYLDLDDVAMICREKGWSVNRSDDPVIEEDIVEFQREKNNEIQSLGYNNTGTFYTTVAKDFFDHFNCKNWSVSVDQIVGNDARDLVSWGENIAGFFSGGNVCVPLRGIDLATGKESTVTVTRWIANRYLWWKKYSKTTNGIKHFIVPQGRGITIYTGDYFSGNEGDGTKEASPMSWTCPGMLGDKSGGIYDRALCSVVDDWSVLRNKLHLDYRPDYDPTAGDNVFYGQTLASLYGTGEKISVRVDDLSQFEAISRYSNNYLNEESGILMDSRRVDEELPVYVDAEAEEKQLVCGWGYICPFSYRYDGIYVVGVGYEDSEEAAEKEAIRAPIAFKFDITKNNKQAFNILTFDMVASGLVYKNPIHVSAEESTSVPQSMSVDNPLDVSEIETELKKLTSQATSGNGIEISIPGLQR